MTTTADARTAIPVPPRQRSALVLSAALHAAVALAWLVAPTARHDVGAGALTVQLLLEPPPAPEPLPPEPPKPQPAKPEPAPEAPSPPQARPTQAKPAPRPAPRAPSPAPAAPTAPEAAQPVMSNSEPAPAAASDDAPASPAVSVGVPNARSAERDDYIRMVWARIMRYRPDRVPFAGTTRLRFALAADGTLVEAEVSDSSGSGLLDRAALDAVRRAAPFPPPPPPQSSGDVLRFEIPFRFETRR